MYKVLSKKEVKKLVNTYINRITFIGSTNVKKEKFKQMYIGDEPSPYLVSSFGRIFSINYMHKKNNVTRLKTRVDKDGYELIIIRYNKKVIGGHVHRFVAMHFIHNKKPKKYTQVNHIDGNKLNNKYYNLEWVTPKENINHAWEHNLADGYGEKNNNNVYKESAIKEVCELLENNRSFKHISKQTGVSYAMVSLIYRKQFWTDISDMYDFSNYNYGK